MSGVKNNLLKATIWSSIQKIGTLGLSFISSIILARLLTPEDYGCVGLLAIFIELSNTLVTGGFGSALIQKKNAESKDYSTVFYWNFIVSILLYLVLFFTSSNIAHFFKMPILDDILKIEGLVIILNALCLIYDVRLRKFLKFNSLAIIDVISTVISLIICITLGYLGYGVWSLVAQYLSMGAIRLVLLMINDKWMPSLVFSFKSFKELFSFGGFMLLTTLFNTLSRNIQGLIIGRKFSATDMGYFSKARSFEEIPSKSITAIISQISLPIFSSIQDDQIKFKKVLLTLNISIAVFVFPIMFLLIIIAKPLIIFLFSEIWIGSIIYFQILCISGIPVSLQFVNYFAVASLGRSKELFNWTLVKQISTIFCIIIGIFVYGIIGMLLAMIVSETLIFIINLLLAKKYIEIDVKLFLKDLLKIFILSFLAGVIPFYISQFLSSFSIILQLFIQVFLYIIPYVLMMKMINFQGKKEITDLVKLFTNKIIKRCKH